VVVGLDLDYKKSKQATISIWRLKSSTNEEGEVEGEVVQAMDNLVSLPVHRLKKPLTCHSDLARGLTDTN
jgi:hypothetical protein